MVKKGFFFLLLAVVLLFIISSCSLFTKQDQVEPPTFDPPGGSYDEEQFVSLNSPTSGVTIVYTLDGTTPQTGSPRYSEPIFINKTTTIKAKALRKGWKPSLVASATYTINIPPSTVEAPVFSLPSGTYNTIQSVQITCATIGATIHYTRDGSNPTQSSARYSAPIPVNSTTTLKAQAFKNDWIPSSISSASYTIDITPPSQFIYVSGGMFYNGTANITISSFYIDKYQITQAEYEAVMGSNPSHFGGNPNHPVEQVSWFDAIEYCNRRSLQEGLTPCYSYLDYGTNPDNWPLYWNLSNNFESKVFCSWTAPGYRLPTEMEWMFAAKGGNESNGYIYSGSNNIETVAWYFANSGGTTHEVGTKLPNELGIHDMSGNVREWCWDKLSAYLGGPQTDPHGWDHLLFHVLRGGSWNHYPGYCSVTNRLGNVANYSSFSIGFRICRIYP